jgi:hypothetical protein
MMRGVVVSFMMSVGFSKATDWNESRSMTRRSFAPHVGNLSCEISGKKSAVQMDQGHGSQYVLFILR